MSESAKLIELKNALWDFLPYKKEENPSHEEIQNEKVKTWNRIENLIVKQQLKNQRVSKIIILVLTLILIVLLVGWFLSLEKNTPDERYSSYVEALINGVVAFVIAAWAAFGIKGSGISKESLEAILKRDIDKVNYELVEVVAQEKSIKIKKLVPIICGAFSFILTILIFLNQLSWL